MNEKQYQLSVTKGPDPGKVYELTSVSMTIGRDPMSEIALNDPEVSRRHARLNSTLSGYRIQDLGSTNGTFVDGVRLSGEPLDLESGQVISIGGGVVLLYQALVDVDELSATMLDVDMTSAESPSPAGNKSDLTTGEPVGDETDELPFSIAEEGELGEPEIEPIPAPESDQVPDDDLAAPATVSEASQYDEESSPLSEPADSYEADDFSEPVVIPHEGDPAKPPQTEQASNYKRLSTIVAAVLLLIICCCCSMLLFLYYYGGDWLLRQMGLLP